MNRPVVAVVMGSKSDAPTMQEGKPALRAKALSLRGIWPGLSLVATADSAHISGEMPVV